MKRVRANLRPIVAAVALATVLAWPAGLAHADDPEGTITYRGGIGTTSDIDPFLNTGEAHDVSGSKTATNLDASDRTKVTLSFPAADYVNSYDIVLVTDATSSYASMAPQAASLIDALSADLASRSNVSIKIGAVAFAMIAYSSFTPGSGAAWDDFVNYVQQGTLAANLTSFLNTYHMSLGASMQALVGSLVALPTWPASMPTGNTAKSYGDLLGGLTPLTATNAAAVTAALRTGGAEYDMQELLAHEAYTNNSLITQMGVSMPDTVIGSNLEAGIRAGQALLDGDTATPAANKFLVILTDGGAYYWNAPGTMDAAQALTGARNNGGTTIGVGQASMDWASSLRASEPYVVPGSENYAGFLATGVAANTQSQISVVDWQAYRNAAAGFPGLAGLTTNFNDRTTYPFTSLEKGTAHAAAAIQQIQASSPTEHIIMIGNDYNPGTPQVANIARAFRLWVADAVGASNYFDLASGTTTVSTAFDSIVNQLRYAFASGTLTDVIGSQFSLVTAGASVAASDVKLTLEGTQLPALVTAPGVISFGTPTGGVYPYVLTVAGQTLTLAINVPIESAVALAFTYTLQLHRELGPTGWHVDVPLNESASVAFVDSDGNAGTATFPVPMTRYLVAESTPVFDSGGSPTGPTVPLAAGLAVLTGLVIAAWRRFRLADD